jgi:hypothetical protein
MASIARTVAALRLRRFFVSALTALTVATSLMSGSTSKEIRIPYQQSHKFNKILVVARVNDRPAVLIVDTGSDRTIVSPRLVNQHRSGRFEMSFLAARRKVPSAWGKANLQLGTKTWKGQEVVVQDEGELQHALEQQVDGILGQDILSQFRRITIDLEDHTLTLHE